MPAAQTARPAAASRSIVSEEASTITSAARAPFAKRSARNAPSSSVSPMAPVVAALAASAPTSQSRASPGTGRHAAASAPSR